MVYGINGAYSWAYSIYPFFKIPKPFSKIKLDYSLKSDLSIMNPDQRYRYLKYSLKQGISSIFGISLLCFGTVLFAQDIAPGAANIPQAGQRENQKSSISAPAPASIASTPSPTETIGKNNPSYGARFCMFAALRPRLTYYEVSIFSSFRSGDCSEEEYGRLSEASISAQLKTLLDPQRIVKLGFHTNVASENLTPRVLPFIAVGASRFDYVATINVNYIDYIYKFITNERFRLGIARASYTPMSNTAPIHYIYNPGSTVYELISPSGGVYIMSSFTNYYNPKLTLANLSDLGTLLNLPPGWKFRSRVLDKQVKIHATAPYYHAEVIYDDFQNFYVEVLP